MSSVLNFYSSQAIVQLEFKALAKDIYDRGGKLEKLKPPKPPFRPATDKK